MFGRPPEWRAVRVANSALSAYDKGDNARALSRVVRARHLFEKLETSPDQREALAQTYHLAAQILAEQEQVDEALEAYTAAERLLSKDASNRQSLGELLHDVGELLHTIGADDRAREYFLRADDASRNLSGGQDPRSRRAADALLDNVTPTSRVESARSALDLTDQGDPHRWQRQYELAVALIETSRSIDESEVVSLLRSALLGARSSEHLTAVLAALSRLTPGALAAADLIDDLDRLSQRARSQGHQALIANALAVEALVAAGEQRRVEALELALNAVVAFEVLTHASPSSALRLYRSSEGDAARALALRLACHAGDHGLVVELIESSRLQAIPVDAGASAALAEASIDAVEGLRHAGRSVLGPISPVSFRNRSRLGDRYPGDVRGVELPLESLWEELAGGGPSAVWGAWGYGGELFWCVVHLDGSGSCGVIDVSGSSPSAASLRECLNDHPSAAPVHRVLTSRWAVSHDSEEEFAKDLGELLVPPPLRAFLSHHPEAPAVRVLIVGNVLSPLPLAGLVVGDASAGFPPRLIERAAPVLVPPAIVIAVSRQVRRRPARGASIAVLDPAGDLPFASTTAVPAGYSVIAGSRAQRADVLGFLSRRSDGPRSLFYSGHVGQFGAGGDTHDGLVLADAPLLAADLWSPGVVSPPEVLLSACSSGGTAGGGGGEWIGLSAALLARGAQVLITTRWPILDTMFTADWDARLLSEVLVAPDPVESLRCAQVSMLWQWRKSRHDFSDRQESDGFGSAELRLPLPIVWASYTALDVRRQEDDSGTR